MSEKRAAEENPEAVKKAKTDEEDVAADEEEDLEEEGEEGDEEEEDGEGVSFVGISVYLRDPYYKYKWISKRVCFRREKRAKMRKEKRTMRVKTKVMKKRVKRRARGMIKNIK